jgi:hypothetical protein
VILAWRAVGSEGGWSATGKRFVKEARVSLTRCRAVRVFLSQLISARPSSSPSPSSSSSLVRLITRFGRARICPKEGRSSSSESEISPSSVQCVLSSPLPKCRMPKGGSTHSDAFALKVSAAYGRAFAVRKQITSRGRLGSGSLGIEAVAQDCRMWCDE